MSKAGYRNGVEKILSGIREGKVPVKDGKIWYDGLVLRASVEKVDGLSRDEEHKVFVSAAKVHPAMIFSREVLDRDDLQEIGNGNIDGHWYYDLSSSYVAEIGSDLAMKEVAFLNEMASPEINFQGYNAITIDVSYSLDASYSPWNDTSNIIARKEETMVVPFRMGLYLSTPFLKKLFLVTELEAAQRSLKRLEKEI